MSNIHQLFSGVQSIHGHNYTHTTREGYAYVDDLNNVPEIQYHPDDIEYYNINPGLYKINIDGTIYAMMIHDTISGSNRLIIKSPDEVFTLMGMTKHNVPLYIFHEGDIIENKGIVLRDSVNDALDLFIVDGITRRKAIDNKVSMKYPSEFQFMSMLDIRVSTDTVRDDYLFNMKNYLKGIEYNRRTKVQDTMYLDRAANRALFVFRTARLILTGFEKYDDVEEYSNEQVCVYKMVNPLCKSNGMIQCSHLPTIKWEEMIDKSYVHEGVCLAPEGEERGFYFKLRRYEYQDKQSFIDDIMRWYRVDREEERILRWAEAREIAKSRGYDPDRILLHSIEVCPVTLLYELQTPQYSHLTLDNYDINTYFNKCWIEVYPYRPPGKYSVEYLNNLIGLEPKNGIMKTIAKQLEESDDPSKYRKIMSDNIVWRDIVLDHYLKDNDMWFSDSVVVIPKNGTLKSNDELLLESGIAEKYQQILDENIIWRDLYEGKGFYENEYVNYDNPNLVAVIPKNNIIKSVEEQLEESGYPSAYATILAENIIWRNLIVTGDLNIRAMFFYKHLKLNR